MPHDSTEFQTINHGIPAGHNEGHHQAPDLQVHGKGRVTFQAGAPTETMNTSPRESSRVHTGPLRMTMGPSGGVTSVGHTNHVYSDAGTTGGSIMSTLRTTGSAASVELQPGNAASRTLLATAEREGLIRRGLTGAYEDAAAPTEPAPGQQQQVEQAPPAEDPSSGAMDHEEEALWQEDIEPLPQHAYDGAAASVVNLVAHGMGSFEDTAKSLASSAGIDPALALEYVQQGYGMHERIVARALAPMGLQGGQLEAFYTAAQRHPAKLQDAIQKLVHGRDVSGFKAMAIDHKVQTTDLTPWKQAGFQAAVDRQTGETMIQHGTGRWMKASELGK